MNFILQIFISIRQPNVYMSKQSLARKIQITCFDLKFKVGVTEHQPIGDIPYEDDYEVCLLDTRSGYPASNTGIFPAFFTLKYDKGLTKSATLDIEIAKPTKIVFSASIWAFLLSVRDKVKYTCF